HARQAAWHALAGAMNYGLSMLRLKGRSDPYYRSMKGGIEAFYRALLDGKPDLSTESGRIVTAGLEKMAQAARPSLHVASPLTPTPSPRRTWGRGEGVPPRLVDRRDGQVLLLGGTGSTGKPLANALVEPGPPVRIMARKPSLAPAVKGELSVCGGDIR